METIQFRNGQYMLVFLLFLVFFGDLTPFCRDLTVSCREALQ